MIIIIDNTKNLDEAYMTPKLINILTDHNIYHKVLSSVRDVNNFINSSEKENVSGIILSGGPLCLSEELTISSINKNIAILLEFHNTPILGICFGFQIMAASYGGIIDSMDKEGKGINTINIDNTSKIFDGLDTSIKIFQSHRDRLVKLPPSFRIIGISDDQKIIQGIESENLKRWGVQFHPEGLKSTSIIIMNFVRLCQ